MNAKSQFDANLSQHFYDLRKCELAREADQTYAFNALSRAREMFFLEAYQVPQLLIEHALHLGKVALSGKLSERYFRRHDSLTRAELKETINYLNKKIFSLGNIVAKLVNNSSLNLAANDPKVIQLRKECAAIATRAYPYDQNTFYSDVKKISSKSEAQIRSTALCGLRDIASLLSQTTGPATKKIAKVVAEISPDRSSEQNLKLLAGLLLSQALKNCISSQEKKISQQALELKFRLISNLLEELDRVASVNENKSPCPLNYLHSNLPAFLNLREEQILKNTRWAINLAFNLSQGLVPCSDLLGAAYTGLCQAVDAHDTERGAAFATYAHYKIKSEVYKEMRKALNWYSGDVNSMRQAFEIAEARLWREIQAKPTDQELAQELGTTEELVRDIRAAKTPPRSLDFFQGYPICPDQRSRNSWHYRSTDEENSTRPSDYSIATNHIPEREGDGVDFAVSKNELSNKIKHVLMSLSEREKEIIKLLYGLADGYSYTYKEVGHIFKVTRERVRQIEAKALRKLQQPSRTQYLIGFLD